MEHSQELKEAILEQKKEKYKLAALNASLSVNSGYESGLAAGLNTKKARTATQIVQDAEIIYQFLIKE